MSKCAGSGCILEQRLNRAVTKALIGGVHIHIFAFCPTNFF